MWPSSVLCGTLGLTFTSIRGICLFVHGSLLPIIYLEICTFCMFYLNLIKLSSFVALLVLVYFISDCFNVASFNRILCFIDQLLKY